MLLTVAVLAVPLGFPLVSWTHRLNGGGDGRDAEEFDQDFREGAIRILRETGKPIAQVGRELGINWGTLGNWVNADRRRREGGDSSLDEDERAELARLRRQVAELVMERDVLKRSVALWVNEAMGR
jgi:transposase